MSAAPSNGVVAVSLRRIKVELLSFVRTRQTMFFTFSMPILLLVLFGQIFHGELTVKAPDGTPIGTGVDFNQYFTAGIIAAGVFGTGFASLAIRIAIEQEDGTLKRLAGTPMPKGAYFVGKLGMVLVVSFVQVALMLVIAASMYGVKLPDAPGKWLTLVWVLGLGALAASLLGVAYSRLIKNSKSAPAAVQPPYLVLQFISGVFFPFFQLPKQLQMVATLFPLKWMTQGLREVFLPASFAKMEGERGYDLPSVALVLGGWTVVGFVLVLAVFRWRGRKDG